MTRAKRYISFLTLQMRIHKSLLVSLFITLAVSQLGIIIWKLLSVRNRGNTTGGLSGIPYFYFEILEQSKISFIFLLVIVVGSLIMGSYQKVDRELYHVPIPFSIQSVLQYIFHIVIVCSLWMYEFFIIIIGACLYQLILPMSMLEPNVIANTVAKSRILRSLYPITNAPRMICVLCVLIVIALIMTDSWRQHMQERKDFFFCMMIPFFILAYSNLMKGDSNNPQFITLCSLGLTLLVVMYWCTSLWYHGRKGRRI